MKIEISFDLYYACITSKYSSGAHWRLPYSCQPRFGGTHLRILRCQQFYSLLRVRGSLFSLSFPRSFFSSPPPAPLGPLLLSSDTCYCLQCRRASIDKTEATTSSPFLTPSINTSPSIPTLQTFIKLNLSSSSSLSVLWLPSNSSNLRRPLKP